MRRRSGKSSARRGTASAPERGGHTRHEDQHAADLEVAARLDVEPRQHVRQDRGEEEDLDRSAEDDQRHDRDLAPPDRPRRRGRRHGRRRARNSPVDDRGAAEQDHTAQHEGGADTHAGRGDRADERPDDLPDRHRRLQGGDPPPHGVGVREAPGHDEGERRRRAHGAEDQAREEQLGQACVASAITKKPSPWSASTAT